jgi:hypothetical protein
MNIKLPKLKFPKISATIKELGSKITSIFFTEKKEENQPLHKLSGVGAREIVTHALPEVGHVQTALEYVEETCNQEPNFQPTSRLNNPVAEAYGLGYDLSNHTNKIVTNIENITTAKSVSGGLFSTKKLINNCKDFMCYSANKVRKFIQTINGHNLNSYEGEHEELLKKSQEEANKIHDLCVKTTADTLIHPADMATTVTAHVSKLIENALNGKPVAINNPESTLNKTANLGDYIAKVAHNEANKIENNAIELSSFMEQRASLLTNQTDTSVRSIVSWFESLVEQQQNKGPGFGR